MKEIISERQPPINKPNWWLDLRPSKMFILGGHWFVIEGINETGIFAKYKEPTGKKRKGKQ